MQNIMIELDFSKKKKIFYLLIVYWNYVNKFQKSNFMLKIYSKFMQSARTFIYWFQTHTLF